MSKLPEAAACPEGTLLHPETKSLCVAAPVDFTEACFSVPAMRAMRRHCPDMSMAVFCPDSQQALWHTVTGPEHVISYRDEATGGEMARLLADYDAAFEAAVIWEAGKAAKALARAGVTRRLGCSAEGLDKFLTDVVTVVRVPGPIEHRVRHYLHFVEKLGCEGFVKANFEKPPLAASPAKPRIVLAPLSEYGSAYQWPVERFKEVMDVMDERYAGIEWLLPAGGGGGKKSAAWSNVQATLEGRITCDDKTSSRAELLDTMRSSSALLASDGELAHMAAHVGLPAAVVFGPNEPEWRRPLGAQSLVIREHVACSPCYLAKCPLDHRCQLQVSVDMVVATLEQALQLRHMQ